MTTSVQRRRGTTAQHSTFTGLEGEITIDTTKDTAVIHDGTTVGGFPLAKENLANANPSNLTALTGASTAADDLFVVYDTSSNALKKITREELNNAMEQDAFANITIGGGSINGTAIGASTASTGNFSTLSIGGTAITSTATELNLLDGVTATTTEINYIDGVTSSIQTQLDGKAPLASPSFTGTLAAAGLNVTGNGILGTNSSNTLQINSTTTFDLKPTITAGTANQVQYLDSSKVLSGSSNMTFDGTSLSLAKQLNLTNNSGYNLYASGTANNYMAGSLGIGSTGLTGYTLKVSKTITGSVSSYGVLSDGQIQSDATSDANYFATNANSQVTTFTVTNIRHYLAAQGTFGIGTTVTNQFGFNVTSAMTGATNNYGFYGNIGSATGRWNLYMAGTASNYFAGSLGIGSTSLTDRSLFVAKNITGATNAYGIVQNGIVQSDVTSNAYGIRNAASTSAASFTLSNYAHFQALQSTIGVGSAITTQYGFLGDSTLISATNNYTFVGNLAAATGKYNIYMAGTADNYLAGSLGIGTTSISDRNLGILKSFTGATAYYGIVVNGQIQSDVTSVAQYFRSTASTSAASFTLTTLDHFVASQGTFGVGSTVTTQAAFNTSNSLNNATNNYGFYGAVVAGTGRYNLYMNGTADNYLAGALGIGSTSLTGYSLLITKNLTGSVTAFGIRHQANAQSDVTSAAYGVISQVGTAAASFTLANLRHFQAGQGTFGVGSSVTTQAAFRVEGGLTGATNNWGYTGEIAAATGAYNIYITGSANNYLGGALGVGSTALTGYTIRAGGLTTGATTAYGIASITTAASDVTANFGSVYALPSTSAASFTLSNLYYFNATQGTFGVGSTVTSQYGVFVNSANTGATNNYGFYGNLAAATGVWNLYMNGTANNYLAGSLGIGTTTFSETSLAVAKNITGGVNAMGVRSIGTVQSDVTTSARAFDASFFTQATAFTLTNAYHYYANGITVGSGSTVTSQMGYIAQSSMTGATNNYAFFGNIAAASGRYNIYMSGSADNYLAGKLTVSGATAIPAGGTAGVGVNLSSTANFGVFFGSGAPTLSAAKGSLYLRSDGSATNNRMYVNTDGATTWTAVTTAA